MALVPEHLGRDVETHPRHLSELALERPGVEVLVKRDLDREADVVASPGARGAGVRGRRTACRTRCRRTSCA